MHAGGVFLNHFKFSLSMVFFLLTLYRYQNTHQ